MDSQRPVPMPNAETAPFWTATAEARLSLPRCNDCDRLFYPPPPRCPHCLSDELVWEDVSANGNLYSWTEIFLEAVPGIAAPTLLVSVELAGQRGLVMHMLAHEPRVKDLPLGSAMSIRFGALENGVRLPYAEPAGDAA